MWVEIKNANNINRDYATYASGPALAQFHLCALCLVAQLWPTVCDPMDYSLPGSSVHGDSPGRSTGVGCHALLQGIFPTQGLNPGLFHGRLILYCLSHQGGPISSIPLPFYDGVHARLSVLVG